MFTLKHPSQATAVKQKVLSFKLVVLHNTTYQPYCLTLWISNKQSLKKTRGQQGAKPGKHINSVPSAQISQHWHLKTLIAHTQCDLTLDLVRLFLSIGWWEKSQRKTNTPNFQSKIQLHILLKSSKWLLVFMQSEWERAREKWGFASRYMRHWMNRSAVTPELLSFACLRGLTFVYLCLHPEIFHHQPGPLVSHSQTFIHLILSPRRHLHLCYCF